MQPRPLPAYPFLSQELELTLAQGLKSGALLPVKVNGGIAGVVALGEMRDCERSPFTQEKLNQGLSLVDRWIQTNGHMTSGNLLRTEQEGEP